MTGLEELIKWIHGRSIMKEWLCDNECCTAQKTADIIKEKARKILDSHSYNVDAHIVARRRK